MKLAGSALILALVLGCTGNVAVANDELDNVGLVTVAAPAAVIVRANAETRTVEAFRVQNVDQARLNQAIAQANVTDNEIRRANEQFIAQVWAQASANPANRIGSLSQIGSTEELNGVSSTPGWRRAWRNNWHWHNWCGYNVGYSWHRPYYHPGHFTYYHHDYHWAGHFGGYHGHYGHGHRHYFPNYGFYYYR